MPRYEYRCADCEEEFERPEHMDEHERSRPTCPRCGGKNVRQMFTSFYAKTSKKS
jgi:putative FmdB family regulatory protein